MYYTYISLVLIAQNIQISVVDEKAHEPRFTQPLYQASLPENAPWGSFVTRVSVSDPDRGAGEVEVAYMLEEVSAAVHC